MSLHLGLCIGGLACVYSNVVWYSDWFGWVASWGGGSERLVVVVAGWGGVRVCVRL